MPKLAELEKLEKLVKEYLAGDQARLTDIKTVWMNTEPKPEGTWTKFCVVRLGKSATHINRQIAGTTGNEARNVNDDTSDVSLLQSSPPVPPITEAIEATSQPTCVSIPVTPVQKEVQNVINRLQKITDPEARAEIELWIGEFWHAQADTDYSAQRQSECEPSEAARDSAKAIHDRRAANVARRQGSRHTS